MLADVASTVTDLDRMTQQNAAMVEQSTAAARTLASVAQQLTAQTARFETGVIAAPAQPAQPIPMVRPAPRARRTAAPVSGNLALKPSVEADWAEF